MPGGSKGGKWPTPPQTPPPGAPPLTRNQRRRQKKRAAAEQAGGANAGTAPDKAAKAPPKAPAKEFEDAIKLFDDVSAFGDLAEIARKRLEDKSARERAEKLQKQTPAQELQTLQREVKVAAEQQAALERRIAAIDDELSKKKAARDELLAKKAEMAPRIKEMQQRAFQLTLLGAEEEVVCDMPESSVLAKRLQTLPEEARSKAEAKHKLFTAAWAEFKRELDEGEKAAAAKAEADEAAKKTTEEGTPKQPAAAAGQGERATDKWGDACMLSGDDQEALQEQILAVVESDPDKKRKAIEGIFVQHRQKQRR